MRAWCARACLAAAVLEAPTSALELKLDAFTATSLPPDASVTYKLPLTSRTPTLLKVVQINQRGESELRIYTNGSNASASTTWRLRGPGVQQIDLERSAASCRLLGRGHHVVGHHKHAIGTAAANASGAATAPTAVSVTSSPLPWAPPWAPCILVLTAHAGAKAARVEFGVLDSALDSAGTRFARGGCSPECTDALLADPTMHCAPPCNATMCAYQRGACLQSEHGVATSEGGGRRRRRHGAAALSKVTPPSKAAPPSKAFQQGISALVGGAARTPIRNSTRHPDPLVAPKTCEALCGAEYVHRLTSGGGACDAACVVREMIAAESRRRPLTDGGWGVGEGGVPAVCLEQQRTCQLRKKSWRRFSFILWVVLVGTALFFGLLLAHVRNVLDGGFAHASSEEPIREGPSPTAIPAQVSIISVFPIEGDAEPAED